MHVVAFFINKNKLLTTCLCSYFTVHSATMLRSISTMYRVV